MRLNPAQTLGPGDLPTMGGEDYDRTYPNGEVTYSTTNHNNELLCIYAKGGPAVETLFEPYEGSWYPNTRIIDNTQLYHIMAQAAGLDATGINAAWRPSSP